MRRNQNAFRFFGFLSSYFFSPFLLLMFFFFCFCFFVFFLAGVIDLLLGLLPVQKFLRKHHKDGQFLPRSSWLKSHKILLRVFHSYSWAFLSRECCVRVIKWYYIISWPDRLIKTGSKQPKTSVRLHLHGLLLSYQNKVITTFLTASHDSATCCGVEGESKTHWNLQNTL